MKKLKEEIFEERAHILAVYMLRQALKDWRDLQRPVRDKSQAERNAEAAQATRAWLYGPGADLAEALGVNRHVWIRAVEEERKIVRWSQWGLILQAS